ncbi:MAG TPA: hypothetical protein DCL41_01900 [Bdellovibrionales bacterium]|nr:hypothetical protein [Bdellovibrionales bacterium]
MRHLNSENLIERPLAYRTPFPRSKIHTARPARPWTHNHFPFRKNASCLIEICPYGLASLRQEVTEVEKIAVRKLLFPNPSFIEADTFFHELFQHLPCGQNASCLLEVLFYETWIWEQKLMRGKF